MGTDSKADKYSMVARSMRLIMGCVCLILGLASSASTECVPSDDPCAPKKLIGAWEKSASVGFNLTDGNSNTTLLNIGLAATLDDNVNIFDISAAYNYGKDESVDDLELGDTTRNDFLSTNDTVSMMTSILVDEFDGLRYI